MYVILFVNNIYCYFSKYAYITNLYRCTPVINSCVYISAIVSTHCYFEFINSV